MPESARNSNQGFQKTCGSRDVGHGNAVPVCRQALNRSLVRVWLASDGVREIAIADKPGS